MKYFYLYCVVVVDIVCGSTEQTGSQEHVLLSLSHNPHVFGVNIKEFVIVGDQDITIWCWTTIPQGKDTSFHITLQNEDSVLKDLDSQNETQLYWSGSPFSTSNLSCKIRFTSNGQSSTFEMRSVITRVVNNSGQLNCFPGLFHSGFLMNEIVQILCVGTSSRNWPKWTQSGSIEFEFQDQRGRYPDNFRVTLNYIRIARVEEGTLQCTRGSGETTCMVRNIELEHNMSISILPASFSDNISKEFMCETNLPTEYISWYIELIGNDNTMQVAPWSEIPWQYMVTHDLNVSLLAFTDASEVTGLKSVACSTSRAGYFVQAKTNNGTFDTSIVDGPRLATGLVVTVIFLSLVCTILGAVTFLLTYKIKRPGAKTTKGSKTVVMSAKTSEDPYYYATSSDFGAITTSGEGTSLPSTTTMTHGKDNEGLSMDVLDNESVVVINSAYEIS